MRLSMVPSIRSRRLIANGCPHYPVRLRAFSAFVPNRGCEVCGRNGMRSVVANWLVAIFCVSCKIISLCCQTGSEPWCICLRFLRNHVRNYCLDVERRKLTAAVLILCIYSVWIAVLLLKAIMVAAVIVVAISFWGSVLVSSSSHCFRLANKLCS